jgi:fibrillarin-like rRNA methylase
MKKSRKLAEQIKKIRPLLTEATPEQKIKLIKLMKQALAEDIQQSDQTEFVQSTTEILDYLEEK